MNTLPAGDLLALFLHFLTLSLLSIGGAMSTAPEMHRYFVVERGWIGAAPGPNVLFVPVLGFQAAGLPGAAAALVGILLPSTLLSLGVSRWGASRRDTPLVRAFTAGLAPVTVGLVFATGWLLALPFLGDPAHRNGALVLITLTALVTLRTKLAPIWMILVGALLGAAGIA